MDSVTYQLRSAGYTVVKGAFPAGHIEELRAALDQMWAEDLSTWGADELEAIGQRGALRNLCDHSAPFQRLLMDATIASIIEPVLGTSYVLHSYDGLILFPGQGRFPWDFHTDIMPLAPVTFPANLSPAVNCLIYIDDVTPANGATWLVPASHHALLDGIAAECLADYAFQAVGSAGDLLVFDGRLWHCAGENRTASPRRVIKMFFSQPWLRPQMEYSRSVRPEMQAMLDARTRRVLGTAPPWSVRELREAMARASQPS